MCDDLSNLVQRAKKESTVALEVARHLEKTVAALETRIEELAENFYLELDPSEQFPSSSDDLKQTVITDYFQRR